MKAIETVYQGYRFRSRLEARWATFFNAIGIQWQYEKEGYVLSDGTCYLPDFWLPSLKTWFEVKGQEITDEEEAKCRKFASEQSLFVSVGNIPIPGEDNCNTIYQYTAKDRLEDYQWVECPFCGTFGITHAGIFIKLPCKCWTVTFNMPLINEVIQQLRVEGEIEKTNFVAKRLLYWGDTPRLIAAYTAARQARFEHGDKNTNLLRQDR